MDIFSGLYDRVGLWVPRMLGTSSFKITAQKMKEVKHVHWIDLCGLEVHFSSNWCLLDLGVCPVILS